MWHCKEIPIEWGEAASGLHASDIQMCHTQLFGGGVASHYSMHLLELAQCQSRTFSFLLSCYGVLCYGR